MRSRNRFAASEVMSILCLVMGLLLAGQPAAAQEPIRIGALLALSGPDASIGTPAQLVTRMVVDKINKEGGINDRPIQLVLGDTQGDPSRTVMEAGRLVEQEKVIALIGPTSTDTGMAVKPYIEETAEVPVLMIAEWDSMIAGEKCGSSLWTFKIPHRTSVAVSKVYGYLKAENLSRIAVLTASDGFGKEGFLWLERLVGDFGLTISARESFNVTDTDMTPQLMKVRESGAQALICWATGPSGAAVAKNLRRLSLKIPLIQCHRQSNPHYIELAGDAAEGSIMPSTKLMVVDQLPENDPQKAVIRDFLNLYEGTSQYHKEYPPDTHSGYAWDAVYLLANAIREGGTDPAGIRNTIEQTKGYVGVSGIYNLAPGDHNGLGTDSLVMVRVEKGKWVLLQD